MSSSLLLFPQRFGRYVLRPSSGVCCLNFWDEACWFLSLRFFRLLSSSLLLFPQRFGWYVLRPSSGVCRTLRTFTELQTTSFIETRGGVACSDSVSHNRVQALSIPVYYSPVVRIEPATFRWLKRYGNNNKDEDNSPKNLNDKNSLYRSSKLRFTIIFCSSFTA